VTPAQTPTETERLPPRQIHLMPSTRSHYLDRHRFYIEQTQKRLFDQFRDIKLEAETLRDEVFHEMSKHQDAEECVESAQDQAVEHYELLSDIKRQLFLAALTGLYHQWERDLRAFLDNEYHFDQSEQSGIDKKVWKPAIKEIFKILAKYDWDCPAQSFYPKLNECRLVVNVYKHGRGSAFADLTKVRPDLFHHPLADMGMEVTEDEWFDHEWLEIAEADFREFGNALEAFWLEFPEIMTLEHGILQLASSE
jgi:hypothetical protein